MIDALKQFLDEAFKIKDLGVLKYFLGIELARSSKGLHLCERKYILDILDETGFLDCKPAPSPMVPDMKLAHGDSAPLVDVGSYKILVGRLLYLTATRPDIAFAVKQLSQFIDSPTQNHLVAAHRVLRLGNLSKYRKSVYGFCIFLYDSLISWKSKKQPTVARSSSKAEYNAISVVVCELHWLQYLLSDLKVAPSKLATLFCDSKSAIAISENHVFMKGLNTLRLIVILLGKRF
ncbi:PREDICTED: uncharacterized protein LOC109175375 [Ipomoea nil]|uniref:uncharacterized protein LOC109175375 n=1 Tax=Ipomoea nil TaxID=35883 RepID=UPI000900959C|nr:PREDICTED: uncharacterized protein LOC109175375 [Ipomoea nil]